MRTVKAKRSLSRVVGIGQIAFDLIGEVDQYPPRDTKKELLSFLTQGGGPVATALVALSRLGVPTTFIGKVSDDYFGKEGLGELREEGVDVSHTVVEPGKVSQFAFIAVERGEDRRGTAGARTIFWTPGTVSPLKPSQIPRELIQTCSLLHLDGLMIEASLEAARWARDAGVPVSLDAGKLREGMLDLVGLSTILIASEEFARTLGRNKGMEKTIQVLKRLGPEQVTVTLGDQGSLTLVQEGWERVPAHPVDVVDTTGAGDVFHGGFIYGYLSKWPLRKSLEFASLLAALKCRKIGGRAGIPCAPELGKFLS